MDLIYILTFLFLKEFLTRAVCRGVKLLACKFSKWAVKEGNGDEVNSSLKEEK